MLQAENITSTTPYVKISQTTVLYLQINCIKPIISFQHTKFNLLFREILVNYLFYFFCILKLSRNLLKDILHKVKLAKIINNAI